MSGETLAERVVTAALARHRQEHVPSNGASVCACGNWQGPFTMTSDDRSYAAHLTGVVTALLALVPAEPEVAPVAQDMFSAGPNDAHRQYVEDNEADWLTDAEQTEVFKALIRTTERMKGRAISGPTIYEVFGAIFEDRGLNATPPADDAAPEAPAVEVVKPAGHRYGVMDGRGGQWLVESCDKYPEPSPIDLVDDLLRPAPASSPAAPDEGLAVSGVNWLAAMIRLVDGNHDKGAGALAEALWPFIAEREADLHEDIALAIEAVPGREASVIRRQAAAIARKVVD